MKKITIGTVLVLGMGVSALGQQIQKKMVTYEFEEGGTLVWDEISAAPNEIIQNILSERIKDCILGNVAGDRVMTSLDEIKKHAADKVNPLVATDRADCDNCESTRSSQISELYGTVTLTCNENGYCCGAHGFYGTSCITFDVATGRELRLEDLFTQGYEAYFGKLGEAKIRKENEIPQELTLMEFGYYGFDEGVTLAQSWLLDGTGISFIYNPYEAGPWSMPPPYFSLTFDEIRAYIRPDGPLAPALAGWGSNYMGGNYRGTIDNKYKIELFVTGAASLSGWYYYEKQGEKKKISITGNLQDNHIVLTESVNGKTTGTFTLLFAADGSYEGTWKGSKGQVLPVILSKH